MFFAQVLFVAYAISVTASSAEWYVPGDLPFVDGLHKQHSDLFDAYLTIGIDSCPGMSRGEASVFMKLKAMHKKGRGSSPSTPLRCLNLVTGSVSSTMRDEELRLVPVTDWTYFNSLRDFERAVDLFQPDNEKLTAYLSHFRQGVVKKNKGLISKLINKDTATGKLIPALTAKAIGDNETELVAKFVDKDGQVLGSARTALVNRPDSDQLVDVSMTMGSSDPTELHGKNVTLKYGLVRKGEPLSNAFHQYSTPYYFTRPGVYKVREAHFVIGQKGKVILDYDFDFPHHVFAYNVDKDGTYVPLLSRLTYSSTKRHDLVVPKGNHSLEISTTSRLDPKKYQPGDSYTISIEPGTFYSNRALDQPNYPGFEFSVILQENKDNFISNLFHSFSKHQ